MNPLPHSMLITTENPPAGEAAPAQAEPQLSPRDAVFKALELEGCRPSFDNDGDIRFHYRDLLYLVLFNARDPEYLRILVPGIHTIGTDAERVVAYEAANLTNSTCKATKIVVERGHAYAAMESFMASHHHVVPVLIRCASTLEYAVRAFAMAYSMIDRR